MLEWPLMPITPNKRLLEWYPVAVFRLIIHKVYVTDVELASSLWNLSGMLIQAAMSVKAGQVALSGTQRVLSPG